MKAPMNIVPGTRIRLRSMPDDPDPIPPGTLGTVIGCTNLPEWTQITVKWDNHRHLNLCIPPDKFEIVSYPKKETAND